MNGSAVAWTWYAPHLGPSVRSAEGVSRADQLCGLAGSDDLIVTMARARGVRRLLLREVLSGRRRVVLLEFIRKRPTGWRRVYEQALGFALRRCAYRLHVLSSAERHEYRKRYRLKAGTVVFVPWPLSGPEVHQPGPPRPGSRRVFASGRAACDWRTLFDAARRTEVPWELTAVCGVADEVVVRQLNTVGAQIEVDVPPQRHDALMSACDVYVLALREEHISSGHVRLMNAIAAGVPVVASDVEGLRDYRGDPAVARWVPPGDPAAVASAVDEFLADPVRRRRYAEQAQQSVAGLTYGRYFEQVARKVLGSADPIQRSSAQ